MNGRRMSEIEDGDEPREDEGVFAMVFVAGVVVLLAVLLDAVVLL